MARETQKEKIARLETELAQAINQRDAAIADALALNIDILPRLKPWDSLDSCSVIQPYRLKYSHSVQDLC